MAVLQCQVGEGEVVNTYSIMWQRHTFTR